MVEATLPDDARVGSSVMLTVLVQNDGSDPRSLEYACQISVEDGPKSCSQPLWNQAPDRRR